MCWPLKVRTLSRSFVNRMRKTVHALRSGQAGIPACFAPTKTTVPGASSKRDMICATVNNLGASLGGSLQEQICEFVYYTCVR